jgi:hypothetical protein
VVRLHRPARLRPHHIRRLPHPVRRRPLSSNIAIPAGRDALQLERRAEQATGQDRLTHRLPVACPTCDGRALVCEDGSEQADRKACHASWPEADYHSLTLVLASEVKGKSA